MTDVEQLVSLLLEKKLKISAAESCTGGMFISKLIDIPGTSDIIGASYITYSDDAIDSWRCVDQAIRRAIKTAWNEQDPEIWNLFFPRIPHCPSNKEFIARIACIVELWQCCKEADYERAI